MFGWCRAPKDWVQVAEVRLREDGHVFFGEAYIVPRGGRAGVDSDREGSRSRYVAQLAR